MNNGILELNLKQLRLPMFLNHHVVFANDAAKNNQSYEQYLMALTEEEILNRDRSRVKSLITKARFPFIKTLGEFKFEEIPGLNAKGIFRLSECTYIGNAENICFLGQTGTGKTHLAIALGLEACKKKYTVLFFTAAELVNILMEAQSHLQLSRIQKKLRKANLVIVDELGYLPLTKEGAELLFQFFADRYEKGSTIISSNLEFADWTKFINDPTMTSALLDRLTHHCHIFTLNGESYRFKQSMKKRKEVQ
jgi:DNA replication protein DnaC